MNPAETPKPFVSRNTKTLNPFPQAFSSSVHENPESTLWGGSDMGTPLESTLQGGSESESLEANNKELAVVTNFIPSASAMPCGEQDNVSLSSLFRHSQINSISSSSSPTNHSHDPNSLNTNLQNLHSAEAERKEHEMEIIDEQPAETTRDPKNFFDVMDIIDQRDLAKHMVGLAIPMAVAPILSTSKLVKATEVRVFLIILSFAIDAIWIGLLLRKTYSKASSVLLMLGIASMMLAFYGFLGCFLPLHLKWIPLIGWLASLIPLAMHGWAHFPRNQEADAERGES